MFERALRRFWGVVADSANSLYGQAKRYFNDNLPIVLPAPKVSAELLAKYPDFDFSNSVSIIMPHQSMEIVASKCNSSTCYVRMVTEGASGSTVKDMQLSKNELLSMIKQSANSMQGQKPINSILQVPSNK